MATAMHLWGAMSEQWELDVCPECGEQFEVIAQHWLQTSCSYPEFTDSQHEVLTGLLMGDGCLSGRNSNRPFMEIKMTNDGYLHYLSSEVFPTLSKSPLICNTAEEQALSARESGFQSNADADNFSDLFALNIMAHPELSRYASWYSSGSKIFPEEIKLTPTTLKHWFVGDGAFRKERATAEITLNNERDNCQKIESMFEWAGFEDFRWNRHELPRDKKDGAYIHFNQEGTKWFFRYIGDPLPGFKRKWPDDRSTLGIR